MVAAAEERRGRATGSGSGDEDEGGLDMFQEPEDFRPATPPPTETSYDLPDGDRTTRITLSLVGSHPLWGHHLWNAAPTTSDYLAGDHLSLCKDANVLELGAAAGLPSIAAHLLGARTVVSTDYPDAELMANLQRNIDANRKQPGGTIVSEGYIWGHDAQALLSYLPSNVSHFDLLLLSDLIFNHQAHAAMLDTMDGCLPPADSSTGAMKAQALVFFTHHRPHLADKDMGFFKQAQTRGWCCEEVGTWKMKPMFPDDPGSEEVRATVHGWSVYR